MMRLSMSRKVSLDEGLHGLYIWRWVIESQFFCNTLSSAQRKPSLIKTKLRITPGHVEQSI
jgi:hypothetical protein